MSKEHPSTNPQFLKDFVKTEDGKFIVTLTDAQYIYIEDRLTKDERYRLQRNEAARKCMETKREQKRLEKEKEKAELERLKAEGLAKGQVTYVSSSGRRIVKPF